MGTVVTIALTVIAIGVIMFFVVWKSNRDTQASQAAAKQLGLELVGADRGEMRAYDFMLFRLQDAFTFKSIDDIDPRLSDVSEGVWDGAPVRTAHFEYRNGEKYFRYLIAVIDVDGSLPRLCVSDERLIKKLSKRKGLEETDLGARLLADRFEVHGENALAAHELLGPDLAAWLLTDGAGYSFETNGGAVAAYKRSGKARDLPAVVRAAKGFGDRIAPRQTA